MRQLANWLVRLYPHSWRARYADEIDAVLSERPIRPLDIVDLLIGMIDAYAHPQLRSRPPPQRLRLAPVAAGPHRGLLAVADAVADAPARRTTHGPVPGPAVGDLTRRSFMRRMLGVGVGLLSLEFLGATLTFLWPRGSEGLGMEHRVGSISTIIGDFPEWARGWPYDLSPARAFLVNVPAATALASGQPVAVPDPSADQILALWRQCPHLGCMIPALCAPMNRYMCRCHGSTYNILGEKLGKGPAERGMDRFPVRIDDEGILIVDTREIIRGAPEGLVTFTDPHPFDAGGCE